jgi:hypothetical protein
MKKTIKLTESDLERIINRVIQEQDEMGDDKDKFTVEPHVKKIPREKQLQNMFGKYEENMPNDLLRYMRKNPQFIMNRLAKIYKDKFLYYADKAHKNANKDN